MEGFYYYWLLWMLWVWITFFQSNRFYRILSVIILLSFVFSLSSITIYQFKIYFPTVIFLISSFYFIGNEGKKRAIFFLVSSFIIMMVYGSFHLFTLYEPVWLLFDGKWMLAILIVYCSTILGKKHSDRLIMIVCGMGYGDLLYSVVLHRIGIYYPVGSLAFLDTIAISITLLTAIHSVKQLSHYLEQLLKQTEKEKQKLS